MTRPELRAKVISKITGDRPTSVSGAESADLIKGLHMTIAVERPDSVEFITLPGGKTASFNADRGGKFHTISNPVSARIGYALNWMDESRHELRYHDGSRDRLLASYPGDALWGKGGKEYIGRSMALSPDGKLLAVVMNQSKHEFDKGGVQFRKPQMLIDSGNLEVWNVDKGTKTVVGKGVLDEGLAWSVDSSAVYLTRAIDAKSALPVPDSGFGSGFSGGELVAEIIALNVSSSKEKPLSIGMRPVCSLDSKTIFAIDGASFLRAMTAAGNVISDSAPAAGIWGTVGALDSRRLIAFGLPTAGPTVEQKLYAKPVSKDAEVRSLKVFDLKTGHFATISSTIPTGPATVVRIGP